MARLVARLRATWAAAFAFAYLFLVGTPFVLHAWWTQRADPLYRAACWGVGLTLRLAGVRVEIKGKENIPRGRVCIYMANHQSNVDPMVLITLLPPRIALMGKKQVFSVPVLGAALRLTDFVRVDRENREAARASVEAALRTLARGVPLLVFPEGTRSPDGRLQAFKHGVFVLAIRAGVPIVPITLEGAAGIMPKKRWEVHPGVVKVTIHPGVETRGRSVEERQQLAEEVRAIVASALPADQRGEASVEAMSAAPLEESF